MKIETDDIKEFQALWKEQFNLEINQEEAQKKAIYLLEMMKSIYKPIPKDKNSEQLTLLAFNTNDYEI